MVCHVYMVFIIRFILFQLISFFPVLVILVHHNTLNEVYFISSHKNSFMVLVLNIIILQQVSFSHPYFNLYQSCLMFLNAEWA